MTVAPDSGPHQASPMNMLPAALAYAQRLNWPVFPVQGISNGHCTCGKLQCDRPGKHPIGNLVPHGLKDASTDPDIIARWWKEAPWANIGVVTGAISGLVVLDVDVIKGGDDSLFALEQTYGKLPETVMALTGSGGFHYLFAHPGGKTRIKNSVDTLGVGLDIRGDGGYIVVAPSLHIHGRQYAWEESCKPLVAPIAEVPPWLLAKIRDDKKTKAPGPGPSSIQLSPEVVARIRAALFYIQSDDRDQWLEAGMALHSTGAGQQAYGLWCEWAQQSDKFDLADSSRVWKSFKSDGGITLKTVFARARAAGWVEPNDDRAEPDISPESCGIDVDEDWKAGLITKVNHKTGEASIPCRAHNLMLIIDHHPLWGGRLAFDEFRQQVTDRGLEWTDAAEIELKAWLEKNWITDEVKTATLREAVVAIASRHTFHPVRDWLESLEWDRTERLPTFFTDFCGTPFTPYSEAVGRALFVSAVARIMKPGAKVDTMVCLEGVQGLGKSKLVQAIFGATWHCEITEAPGGLDFYQNLRGKWVGEFSELSAMGKVDQNRVKQALTQTQDTYRASYGRHSRTYPRQFIFIGNTNKHEYLMDETGARRYLPIECTEIDAEAVEAIRDQLFAEAVVRYRSGEKWWDITGAEKEQDARYQQDVWEEKIAGWLRGKLKVTILEVMEECLMLKSDRQGRSEQTRIGMILRRLNWGSNQETTGDRRRFYSPKNAMRSTT